MKNLQKKTPIRFQPLTCIRQLGITRGSNGAATYSFVAQVSRDLPSVRITLHVTTDQSLSIGAVFDDHVQVDEGQEDNHRIEGAQLSLPMMGTGG